MDLLKFNLDRFDKQIEHVHNKAAGFLALNTFIVGGAVGAYYTILHGTSVEGIAIGVISTLILTGLISATCTITAIYPNLNSGQQSNTGSVFFFGSITDLPSPAQYLERVKSLNAAELERDLSEQVYLLATSLRSKYTLLQYAALAVAFEMVILLPLAIIIIYNLKSVK